MNPAKKIRRAMKDTKLAAAAACDAANELAGLIRDHRPALASDVTILQGAATQLQHVSQHFGRAAKSALAGEKAKPRRSRR